MVPVDFINDLDWCLYTCDECVDLADGYQLDGGGPAELCMVCHYDIFFANIKDGSIGECFG
jgi:hypothetical protein